MTDEEFKEYLDKSISDEDIKQMFDCLTPDYILTGDELTELLELYSGTPTSILRTLSKLDGGTVRFTSNSQRNLFDTVLRDIQKSYWNPTGERIRTYVEPSFLDGSISQIRLDYMLMNGREMNRSYTFYVES
jgi:hypothetical protein